MATEQLSPELAPQKRQRRLKPNSQVLLENPTTDETTTNSNKHSQTKPVQSSDENTTNADLYEPGDIVWSKLGSFPWWPALIYRCDAEGGIYTKTLNSNNKSKRQFFVYFYGKYLEYAWLSTRSLLKYAGLSSFIQNAESAVQQASTKSEQVELANRYQLKVSIKKRVQWDEAIALADHALTMTRDERIKEFSDLLNGTQNNKKQSKNSLRRRNSELYNEKSFQASAPFQTDAQDNEQPVKKKRGRKPKSELETLNSNANPSIKLNEKEIEYEYLPIVNDNQQMSSSFLQTNIPPLSNFEQKQIVEGLINHNQDKTLTFDEAQSFAMNKAIEIIYENHNYRMNDISSEWFYDSILLKYPSIVFKYRSWFEHIRPDIIPDGTDIIKLKQWQIALMIEAQIKAEQQSSNEN